MASVARSDAMLAKQHAPSRKGMFEALTFKLRMLHQLAPSMLSPQNFSMQRSAARLAKRQKCGCGENLYANDGCKEQALRSRRSATGFGLQKTEESRREGIGCLPDCHDQGNHSRYILRCKVRLRNQWGNGSGIADPGSKQHHAHDDEQQVFATRK